MLDGSLFGPDQPCFGCAPDHPYGFRLRLEEEADGVRAAFTPNEHHQGPPGVMHGGLVMALADEIGAWTVISATGKFGFTAGIDGKLRKPVRIAQEVNARGRVSRDNPRVVSVEVEIEQEGEICFSAQMRFAVLDRKGAEKLLDGPIPDSWMRFAR